MHEIKPGSWCDTQIKARRGRKAIGRDIHLLRDERDRIEYELALEAERAHREGLKKAVPGHGGAAEAAYPRNARVHSKAQIKQIARSIERFGFTNPVLIDAERQIIAGHGRVAAATLLGIEAVPCLRLDHLSEAEKRAYILADNKLALNAGWDREVLAIELQHRVEGQFDVTLTGFSVCEVDILLAEAASADPNGGDHPDDLIPEAEDPANAVTISGDIWRLGRHLLICGDARDPSTFAALMGGDRADMIFTDPPYNVPIDGHVCGSGKIHHREFAMGTGEMSSAVFTSASVMRRSRPDGCSIRSPAYARYFLLSPAGSPVVGR